MDIEWPVGRGMVALDIVYLLLAWIAGLYSLAIDRLQNERRRVLAFARRLLIAGTILLAGNATYRLWTLGDLPISVPALLGQCLMFCGVILLARGRLNILGFSIFPPSQHRPPSTDQRTPP